MTTAKFKLIIFDWSGVISDTFDNWYTCAMAIFKQYGAPIISKKRAREEFRQPYMAFYNKFLPDLSHENQKQAYAKAIQRCDTPPIFNGMKELLADLYQRDVRMAVISGDIQKTLLQEADRFQVRHFFKDILWDVYHKDETVRKMIRDLQFKPDDVLFVGDSTHEVEVGKKVGCKTCAVTWGYMPKEKLRSLHPDYLVDTTQELEEVIFGK